MSRNKLNIAVSGTASSDDYWVGSDKIEFKPHPLLMPSTPRTSTQIPLPILPVSSLTTPSSFSSSEGGNGGEVDDLSESASEEKGKTRRSRSRKKSRGQRRLEHRTLWARQNGASNITATNAYVRTMPHNPYFLHNHGSIRPHQLQQQQQSSVILTAGSGLQQQSPLLISPYRQDDSFHGSAWPNAGNGIIAPNLVPGYLSGSAQPESSHAPITSSSREVVQTSQQFPLQQYQVGYPQFHQHHQQTLAAQLSQAQQQVQQLQNIPGVVPQQYPIIGSAPEFLSQQQQAGTPVVLSGSSGPVVVYLGGGAGSGVSGPPASSLPLQSTPVLGKPFNLHDIQSVGYPHHLQFNSVTGPDGTGQHDGHQHLQPGMPGTSKMNPQYMRNNFIRRVMDRMATVGRYLPIPFVTKYSSPPNQQGNVQGQLVTGYGRTTNYVNRRM